MAHFLLKFNHGVEIGARLAYLGHFRRTRDPQVWMIASEELQHREYLKLILESYSETSSKPIDVFFEIVGHLVGYFCQISPNFMLNLVAMSMEWFAVFNYQTLSRKYPHLEFQFKEMAAAERRHEQYFCLLGKR